ncbi:hypothetical protein BS78_08G095300 [Paspalum vaginatum]|nr:hypothetical protein BS78_08G095300 [Paspalum vaginatum]
MRGERPRITTHKTPLPSTPNGYLIRCNHARPLEAAGPTEVGTTMAKSDQPSLLAPIDHVAVKFIKNQPAFYQQAIMEVSLFRLGNSQSLNNKRLH